MTTPNYIVQRCTSLKKNWSSRDKKFVEWYDILKLVDELEQEGMESVTTNDPRTAYNLAKHLLTSMTIADRIPSDELVPESIPATTYLEQYVSKRWSDQEKRYRSIGRQSWLGELFSWMLSLGWYSVFAMVTDDEVWSEISSPAECYPEYGPDGLVEHAHIYELTPAAANRKVQQMGWKISRPFTDNVKFYDHWAFDADGDPVNAIVAGTEFVKEPVKDPRVAKVGILPVFTGPVGGLPDRGSVKKAGRQASSNWQQNFGESIVASAEDLVFNYNKMRSYLQQAARSAAQPHWLELSAGESPIATESAMNRWGSILRGAPGESVEAIQHPPIPVELTNMMYTYQNELQRTWFPYSVYGNIQQQLSYLAMANIASASMQTLTPYINGFRGIRTDINNFWTDMILLNGLHPHKFSKPQNIPDRLDRLFDVETSVEIPGYLIQRATVSRMMNPDFKLPVSWVTERMFPEIKNPLKAQADTRSEEAMRHPKAILVDQIMAYLEQARQLRKVGGPNNIKSAELYEKLAASLETELDMATQQPQRAVSPESQMAQQSIMREAFPQREGTTPLEGMGRV